jgi:protein O-mannosyl-transferase
MKLLTGVFFKYGLFCLIAVLCIGLYWRGLDGPLLMDDLHYLPYILEFNIPLSFWPAYLMDATWPFKRLVSMLSFLINTELSNDIWYLKLTNLCIHLLNGGLVFLFSVQIFNLTGNKKNNSVIFPACLVAIIWVIHPLHVSTVLYTIQRMSELSACFALLCITSYIHFRTTSQVQKSRQSPLWVLACITFFLLGILSKENALLIPIYLLLIELLFLKFRVLKNGEITQSTVIKIVLLLPLLLGSLYLAMEFDDRVLSGYQNRDFTLSERVLTESRVLMSYLSMILIPAPSLMGFVHDDIQLSSSLISPITTLTSLLVIAVFVSFSVIFRKKYPIASFGILFFLTAHLMESTVFSLELMFEHRNYLASFGVILMLISLIDKVNFNRFTGASLIISTIAIISFSTWVRAGIWSSDAMLFPHMARSHPQSKRIRIATIDILLELNKLSDARKLIVTIDDQGKYFHSLKIDCLQYGQISDAVLIESIENINGYLNMYLLDKNREVFNLGISGACQYSFIYYLALLDKLTQQPIIGQFEASKLHVYKAHLAWRLDDIESAIQYLETAQKIIPADALPSLLAAEWLSYDGQLTRAEKYLQRSENIIADSWKNYSPQINSVRKRIDLEYQK